MNYPVKIVGFVIDVHNLTMYMADGETLTVPQGDPRIKPLVANLVAASNQCDSLGVAFSYMLQIEDMEGKNYFAEAEKKTNGVVRFFRMAKAKVKELVEKFVEPIGYMEVGAKKEMEHSVTGSKAVSAAVAEVMDQAQPAPITEVVTETLVPELKPVYPKEDQRPLTKSAEAVAEIMANAMPTSHAQFGNVVADEDGESDSTVVAVLDDNTIIPGAEALAEQAAAVAQGVTQGTGMANFLRRAGMIKRGHSVEDLLKFVQKGELPLADDGCVLVYKLLKRTRVEGEFVDVHSGRVKQRVGSFVHMDEHMVDPNRRQDCSNGLHVARRDYLGSFSGDVCVLAKLAPEDVIAVPQYDARKLRAKGYHIIAELTDADRARVCRNLPMEDQVLLGNAIAGNHAEVIEYVKITEQKGGGLVITAVENAQEGLPALDTSLAGKSLDHLEHKEELPPEERQVDARAIALAKAPATVQEEQVFHAPPAQMNVTSEPVGEAAPAPSPIPAPVDVPRQPVLTPVQKLVKAFEEADSDLSRLTAAMSLLAYKKSSKKSWTALGVPAAVFDKAIQVANEGVKQSGQQEAMAKAAESLPKTKPSNDDKVLKQMTKASPSYQSLLDSTKPVKAKPKATGKAKAPSLQQVAKPAKVKASPAKAAPANKAPKMTQQEQMAKLVEIYQRNPDKTNAREIFNFKQKAKKSWEVLGVTDKAFQKKITERAKL